MVMSTAAALPAPANGTHQRDNTPDLRGPIVELTADLPAQTFHQLAVAPLMTLRIREDRMNFVDLPGVLRTIDQAIAAIDEFDGVYRKALDSEGPTFRRYWDQALEVEQRAVLPRLELTRQIAAHVGADELPITSPPNKRMGKSHPFQANRAALVILRTRLAEREKMASVLGPAGPQLSTSSLHKTIWNAAARLFDGGHYRQAVQTASQALESHLQTIAGARVGGQDLAKLFAAGGDGVRLHFAELDPNGKTYASVREGTASLIRGAMMGVRNLVSHPEWPEPSESEALEMLAVLSYIAHLVDRAERVE